MEKKINIYNLHSSKQYEDEKAYWDSKTTEERLHTLEVIRKTGYKLHNHQKKPVNGDQQRFRRVLRVFERA